MKIGNLFAYAIIPIDNGWNLLPTVDEHLKKLAISDADGRAWAGEQFKYGPAIREFLAFTDAAFKAAGDVGWEGDTRGDVHVGFLPDELEMATYLVWKQDNNGTTFVVSPIPLPHLEALG